MRLYPPAIEIGETEGFDPAKDIFKRVEIARGLTNLVSSVTDPMVLAIDGQWGSGKTVFLKMWAGELRKQKFPVIYFDAFENDYAEDAFTAIASEIIALAQEHEKAKDAATKEFVKQATKASKIVLRSSLKLGVKAATLGVLSASDLEEIAADVAGEASTLTDKYVGELLTKQRQRKSTLQAFRDALSKLPALLAAQPKDGEVGTRPLIFIIDELDRCRPLFALEVLERIKHFFTVLNVHFVLGTHLTQLQNSVSVVYGSGIDAQRYLQKFVHFTLMLDRSAEYPSERIATKFMEHLVRSLQFKRDDGRIVELCVEFVGKLAERRDLTLRSIERIFSALALALAFSGPNALRLPPVLAGLCVLKVEFPDLFRKAKKGLLVYSDVAEVLALGGKDRDGEHDWATKWWMYCSDYAAEGEWLLQFDRDLGKYGFSTRFDAIPFIANKVIDRLLQQGE